MWYLYIIEKSDKYYTGITTDLKNRLRQYGNLPLLYKEIFSDKYQAAKREKTIKVYSKEKKGALVTKFSR